MCGIAGSTWGAWGEASGWGARVLGEGGGGVGGCSCSVTFMRRRVVRGGEAGARAGGHRGRERECAGARVARVEASVGGGERLGRAGAGRGWWWRRRLQLQRHVTAAASEGGRGRGARARGYMGAQEGLRGSLGSAWGARGGAVAVSVRPRSRGWYSTVYARICL